MRDKYRIIVGWKALMSGVKQLFRKNIRELLPDQPSPDAEAG